MLENEANTYIDIACRGASRLVVTPRWQYGTRQVEECINKKEQNNNNQDSLFRV